MKLQSHDLLIDFLLRIYGGLKVSIKSARSPLNVADPLTNFVYRRLSLTPPRCRRQSIDDDRLAVIFNTMMDLTSIQLPNTHMCFVGVV